MSDVESYHVTSAATGLILRNNTWHPVALGHQHDFTFILLGKPSEIFSERDLRKFGVPVKDVCVVLLHFDFGPVLINRIFTHRNVQ